MKNAEITNTKFNTTQKIKLYNREKDKQFFKMVTIIGSLGLLGFLFGRTLKL